MKFRVYTGFLDWSVMVDAPNEHLALVKGKQKMIERLQDADVYAVELMALDHVHSWDGDRCHYCQIPRSSVERPSSSG